jgi:hypothetical protein
VITELVLFQETTMTKILKSPAILFVVFTILTFAQLTWAASSPEPVEVQGGLGYVARLADGRLIAVHGECRPREKWDDASIAQPVFGRFSSDGGRTRSRDSLLFNSPAPGWLHTVLPLGERDGTIHLLGLIVDYLSSPMDWTKARADFWHTTSRDAGKTWKSPRRIGLPHRYTGQINSGIQLKSGRLLIAYSYLDEKRATGYFVSHVISSDDHGETWRASKNDVPVASGGKLLESGAAEPVVVELADGRIWMVIRTQTGFLLNPIQPMEEKPGARRVGPSSGPQTRRPLFSRSRGACFWPGTMKWGSPFAEVSAMPGSRS